MSSRRPRSTASPVTVRRPDAAAWQRALVLADGDPRRLRVLADGTVMVRNQPTR